MDTLLDIPKVCARYGCSRQFASKIIKSGPHLTSPRLMVPEWALVQWEREQMEPPKPKAKKQQRAGRVITMKEAKQFEIPRRRV